MGNSSDAKKERASFQSLSLKNLNTVSAEQGGGMKGKKATET